MEKSNLKQASNPAPIDHFGRSIRYLRLSVTDRCNLSCLYCSDVNRQNFIPHEKIMRYEHFLRLGAIASKLGVRKIRITGGEPFARKGCMDLLRQLRQKLPHIGLAITTNATIIADNLKELAALKPLSINISLDSFRADTFRRITGHNLHPEVLANIDGLLALGVRVKLNAVLLKGTSDMEADDFVHAVRNMPIDMRFIEFMPMGSRAQWARELFLPAEEMKQKLEEKLSFSKVCQKPDILDGPARMFAIREAKGKIGFITAISNHFCRQCNRLRVTSDGKLRPCLFSDKEYDIGGMLTSDRLSDAPILKLLKNAGSNKPLGENLLKASQNEAVASKEMSGIGG